MNITIRIPASFRSLGSRQVIFVAIASILAAAACIFPLTIVPPEEFTIEPNANVAIEPAVFCLGDIMQVDYSDGSQLRGCDPGDYPDDPTAHDCKGHEMWTSPFAAQLLWEYPPGEFRGSDTAVATMLTTYTATYRVFWEGWAAYRAYRERDVRRGGLRPFTGAIYATDTMVPVGAGGALDAHVAVVCDPETGTWQLDTGDWYEFHRTTPPGHVPTAEERTWRREADGAVSACVGITQVCLNSDVGPDEVWIVSVEGGPSVTLGGDNPRCTDAFAGYHPDDIVMTPGPGAVLPGGAGEPVSAEGEGGGPVIGEACVSEPGGEDKVDTRQVVSFRVAGSNMCVISTDTPASGSSLCSISDPDIFGPADCYVFGDIELHGTAAQRCRDALHPDLVAAIDEIRSISLPIVSGDSCDLDTTCGDGVCLEGCEDNANCSQDCSILTFEGICGDGVVNGDEVCEVDADCRTGFFCGDPGTNAPCACVATTLPGVDQPEGDNVCVNAARVEIYPVFDCTLVGGTTYAYYEGIGCWDANDALLYFGRTSEQIVVDHWVGNCPGGAGDGDGGDGQSDGGQICGPNDPNCP